MYRETDRSLFMVLSLVATLSLLASLASIITYHFFDSSLFYRDLGFMLLILSALMKLQMYLHKLIILERRVSGILQPTSRKSSWGKGVPTLGLWLYAVIFWVVLASVIIGFIPITGWSEYLPR